jgi:predicted O-linked N-acetylglucosamine transferase (SPINDLY family)
MANPQRQEQQLVAGWRAIERGDPGAAEAIARDLLRQARPDALDVLALNLLAVSLMQQSRHDEALAALSRALEREPSSAGTLLNLGSALMHLGRHEEAVAHLERAAGVDPRPPQVHNNLGHAYRELGRFDEALESFRKVVERDPANVDALAHIGIIHRAQGRLDEAIATLRAVVAVESAHWPALVQLGAACQERGLLDEALAHFERAVTLDPASGEAQHNLGIVLQGLARHDEAIAAFERALALAPGHKYTQGALLWSELQICRWGALGSRVAGVRAAVRSGVPAIEPFPFVAVSEDPEEQRGCAARFYEDRVKARAPLWRGERYVHAKIRVAYLSADFREHAVAYCIGELVELHDRSKFEVLGVSLGRDDGSAMRARFARSFDRFVDIRSVSDLDAARLLREAEADVVVDLMGYTRGSRPVILAHRPAPAQAGYLGYPGTVGAACLDYILADRFVLPEADEAFFSEKAVRLPGSYQANDRKRDIAPRVPGRAEIGLPERGFVFCCFNNNYKIAPDVFGAWMRLLGGTPGSVLWLLEDNLAAGENLRREARARGVDPARLVFASRLGAAEYRARCRLADLCLDTVPYNGHGTTSDMLWAGVPVLTCAGTTFAGRVAGSLLRAVGLPELVTASLEEYEALALRLARGDPLLAALRARLEAGRASAALFDTDRFRRHLESAYRTMWEIAQRGEPPRAFDVEAVA